MSKLIAVILMVGALALAESYVWYGQGATGTATTTATVVSVPNTNYCYEVSIQNTASEDFFFQIGTTTNGFVATNAICVPANSAYTFPSIGNNELKRRQIYGVVIATTNSTSGYVMAFQ